LCSSKSLFISRSVTLVFWLIMDLTRSWIPHVYGLGRSEAI
jgi:hypothetical protein